LWKAERNLNYQLQQNYKCYNGRLSVATVIVNDYRLLDKFWTYFDLFRYNDYDNSCNGYDNGCNDCCL
jgi:hypothetical protein